MVSGGGGGTDPPAHGGDSVPAAAPARPPSVAADLSTSVHTNTSTGAEHLPHGFFQASTRVLCLLWFLKGIIHTELVVSSDTHVFFP